MVGDATDGRRDIHGRGTYAMQRASYAAFSFWITATIVFMMALVGLPEPEAAWRRIVATLIGAALAIIAGSIAAPRGLLR
ncbi:MAG: hypothetical protein V7634_4838 [Bradyrhizobium sp.]|jgi:uncharacterized membrane protein YccC